MDVARVVVVVPGDRPYYIPARPSPHNLAVRQRVCSLAADCELLFSKLGSGRWNDGRFAMRRRMRAIAAPAQKPDGGQVRLEAFAFAARGCAQVYFGKVLLESLTGRRVWLYQLCNRPVQVEMRGSTIRLSARLQYCLGQVPRHSQGCVLVSGPCKGNHETHSYGT